MVFTSPKWVPQVSMDPSPDNICDFILDEKWGRHPMHHSRPPFTCGLTGAEHSIYEVRDRVNALARALSKELGWEPNKGTEWDKVIAIFSLNTIDTMTLNWAVHSLSGISSPANAAYSEAEVVYQLKSSGAKALFTCLPLLHIAIAAAQKAGIPKDRVYLLSVPKQITGNAPVPKDLKTVDQLIKDGASQPQLEKLKWSEGQGAKQTAFLCYSSGTSGLPKGVMISHRNVISNVLQIQAFEKIYRNSRRQPRDKFNPPEIALGLLPQSHIYSLVVICHATTYRGDQVINLPKFEFGQFLSAIQRFKIESLFLVPPIIITMANNKSVLDKFDLNSVRVIFSGAAPLGEEVAKNLLKVHSTWKIRQGYGLTETCTVVTSTDIEDIWFGSSGSLLPLYQAKIMSSEGVEITEYNKPGELVVKSPSVVLGYLNNEKANKETFENGWMRTGDEVVVRVSPKGHEHIFIVDRLKELIKGMQVAPAELEAHLLVHPSVADCAVISVHDDNAGERPKAFVVKSSSVGLEDNDRMVMLDIAKHVKDHKARHKWLDGGIEFIDVIPKSPSGKILRRILRDKEREQRRLKGAKL